jgi:hypothetical protein
LGVTLATGLETLSASVGVVGGNVVVVVDVVEVVVEVDVAPGAVLVVDAPDAPDLVGVVLVVGEVDVVGGSLAVGGRAVSLRTGVFEDCWFVVDIGGSCVTTVRVTSRLRSSERVGATTWWLASGEVAPVADRGLIEVRANE